MKFNLPSLMNRLGVLSLLFSISSTEAIKSEALAEINAKIEALTETYHKALIEEGSQFGKFSHSEIRESIHDHLNNHMPLNNEFFMLRKSHHHHKHHSKKHAPLQDSFVNAKAENAQRLAILASQVTVPIDDANPIGLTVSPTFGRDVVESVTLKSFRKVVGYDTFNSIRRKDRDETKDPTDHYNITVSIMVQRKHEPRVPSPSLKGLSHRLDKGFPYDDGDNTVDAHSPNWRKQEPVARIQVGSLNGNNITNVDLKNLVRDTQAPITQQLIQIGQNGDEDHDEDEEVRRARLEMKRGQLQKKD